MQSFNFQFILTTILFLTQPEKSLGQDLTVEYADIKLFAPNAFQRPYYDGQDTIYLFDSVFTSQIEIFSVATETITRTSLGSMPGVGYGGNIQTDNAGNIFYFGGGSGYDVFKFDPTANQSEIVATLPINFYGSTSVKYSDSSNTVYIFGGYALTEPMKLLLAFDLESLNYTTVINSLPYQILDATAVWFENKAYIFNPFSARRKAIELDLDTYRMIEVGPDTLPEFWYSLWPTSVKDESHAYLVGGYFPSEGPTGGMYRFDLTTFENTFLPVKNFPVDGPNYYYYTPAMVYVGKQDRIYFFGGYSYDDEIEDFVMTDDIFYIKLSPLKKTNRDVFDCFNQTNGFYSYPNDCEKFVGCQDGKLDIFTCPSTLLFDSVTKTCTYPDQVECVY